MRTNAAYRVLRLQLLLGSFPVPLECLFYNRDIPQPTVLAERIEAQVLL